MKSIYWIINFDVLSFLIIQDCFSAVDIFNQMNLSTKHNELDSKQFSTASVILISYLLDGKCVNVDNDDSDLPCKSYFTSKLLEHFNGVDGHISYQGFKEILGSIGLGNESSHGNEEEGNDHDHNHRRRRRDISDNSMIVKNVRIQYNHDFYFVLV